MRAAALILHALHPARAPAGIVLLVFVALVLPPQTGDMMRSFGETPAGCVAFQLALAILAFSAWYWSRAALNAERGIADRERGLLPRIIPSAAEREAWGWGPRLLFALVGLTGLLITLRSQDWWQAAFIALWSSAALVGLRRRKRHPPPVAGAPKPPIALSAGAPWDRPLVANALTWLGLAIFLASSVETYLQPSWCKPAAWVAIAFPGPAAALVSFALMLGPLTGLTSFFDRHPIRLSSTSGLHVPVVTLLVAVMVVMPRVLPLHLVRTADRPVMSPDGRTTLRVAFQSWADRCSPEAKTLRPVIVALSGGASRAGLWGARVVRDVDEAMPAGSGGIFAISSVSGGSLGAANTMIMLARSATPCRLPSGPDVDQVIKDRFSSDLLGPLLSAAILDDSARALTAPLFWPVLVHFGAWPERGGDRAGGLERGFERAWRAHPMKGRRDASLSVPFLSLFYGPGPKPAWRPGMPVWISNGTDEATGRRLLTIPGQTGRSERRVDLAVRRSG